MMRVPLRCRSLLLLLCSLLLCSLLLCSLLLGSLLLGSLLLGSLPVAAQDQPSAAQPARPLLQIINGSDHAIDIYWLKSESERVSNGTVPPYRDTVITTTIGHRFALVDREREVERQVTALVPVQAYRYQPAAASDSGNARAVGGSTVEGEVTAPPAGAGIPTFYTKFISAGGYPIVASASVNDYALKEAAFLVNLLLAQRPDVREAMIRSGSRMCILGHNEFTTDLPEFARLGPPATAAALSAKDYWDARARGTGGSQRDPYCSCGEENLLGYPGDPYAAECILIHEFAHNIHLRGMTNVDPTFDRRVKQAYDRAMSQGLWKGKYAAVNHHEYFAEGVQSWFDNNRENDHDHNHVDTRDELLAYDPALAALCREVFGETEVKYTKPATRLTGHLAGYDPRHAPRFVWPERLDHARSEIRNQRQRPGGVNPKPDAGTPNSELRKR